MIEYRIDTLFNGNVIAYQIIKKRVGIWPFHKWVICKKERLYYGHFLKDAQKAIDNRVLDERGQEIKYSQYKNDKGEDTPARKYMWW